MSTQKEIDANRENAQKSTGPSSSDGLKRSSLNSTVHGFTGQTLLLSDAEKAPYEQFVQQMRNEFNPCTGESRELLQNYTDLRWSIGWPPTSRHATVVRLPTHPADHRSAEHHSGDHERIHPAPYRDRRPRRHGRCPGTAHPPSQNPGHLRAAPPPRPTKPSKNSAKPGIPSIGRRTSEHFEMSAANRGVWLRLFASSNRAVHRQERQRDLPRYAPPGSRKTRSCRLIAIYSAARSRSAATSLPSPSKLLKTSVARSIAALTLGRMFSSPR